MKLTTEKKTLIAKLKKETNKAITEAYEKTNCSKTRNEIFIQCWQLFETKKLEIINL